MVQCLIWSRDDKYGCMKNVIIMPLQSRMDTKMPHALLKDLGTRYLEQDLSF